MSKGSKPRPTQISKSEYDLRWELIASGTTDKRKLEILEELRKLQENKNNN